jgi:hypothetical protein
LLRSSPRFCDQFGDDEADRVNLSIERLEFFDLEPIISVRKGLVMIRKFFGGEARRGGRLRILPPRLI